MLALGSITLFLRRFFTCVLFRREEMLETVVIFSRSYMSPPDVPESCCSMSMTATVIVIGLFCFVSLSFRLIFPL